MGGMRYWGHGMSFKFAQMNSVRALNLNLHVLAGYNHHVLPAFFLLNLLPCTYSLQTLCSLFSLCSGLNSQRFKEGARKPGSE